MLVIINYVKELKNLNKHMEYNMLQFIQYFVVIAGVFTFVAIALEDVCDLFSERFKK